MLWMREHTMDRINALDGIALKEACKRYGIYREFKANCFEILPALCLRQTLDKATSLLFTL